MDPFKVPYYKDRKGNSFKVEVIVPDFDGLAIGRVFIDDKPHYVVRWNGDNDDDVGFPQSHGHPVWMLLPRGIKLSIEL